MDAKGLRAIAEATGGTFGDEVPELSVTRRTGRSERRENRYQWPLGAAVLLYNERVVNRQKRQRLN